MFTDIAQPAIASASGLWWQPWSMPEEVEAAIPSAFETEGTLEEQTIHAARTFLAWRVSQIPKLEARAKAEKFVAQAFKGESYLGDVIVRTQADVEARVEELFSIFPPEIRNQVPRTLGGFKKAFKLAVSQNEDSSIAAIISQQRIFVAKFQELRKIRGAMVIEAAVMIDETFWINPLSRDLPHGAALATLAIHELGGHFADQHGASGFFAQAVHRFYSSLFVQLLNPIGPITLRTIRLVSELEAMGVEWEFWHRVPRAVREKQMDSIRLEMGDHADLLKYSDASARTRETRKRFGDSFATRRRYSVLAQNFAALEAVDLSKGEYVNARGKAIGYNFWDWSHLVTRTAYASAVEEGMMMSFWTPRIFDVAKMAALGGAILYALS